MSEFSPPPVGKPNLDKACFNTIKYIRLHQWYAVEYFRFYFKVIGKEDLFYDLCKKHRNGPIPVPVESDI